MKIKVNGEDRETQDGTSLDGLLDILEVSRKGIAVECNREIVPRGRLSEVILKEGDIVEIIRMVGGG
ncbi:MAG: sulfur carrier protein ThiS [Thermodesulfobacteriota bacterium]